jgi:hypothetical protein
LEQPGLVFEPALAGSRSISRPNHSIDFKFEPQS